MDNTWYYSAWKHAIREGDLCMNMYQGDNPSKEEKEVRNRKETYKEKVVSNGAVLGHKIS